MSLPTASWRARPARACAFALLIALAVAFSGCSPVRFIAEYDEQIDRSATQLQKDLDSFLTHLETTEGTPEAEYESNQSFYADYMVELRSLLLRAESHTLNDLTEKQLGLMISSVDSLQAIHKDAPLIPEVIDVLRSDLSQSWKAIIALELAKKRGAEPEELEEIVR